MLALFDSTDSLERIRLKTFTTASYRFQYFIQCKCICNINKVEKKIKEDIQTAKSQEWKPALINMSK